VSLNIKNERVHALAREVAARTGQSQTSAIESALRRVLAELDRDDRWRRVDEILAEFDRTGAADRIPENSDFLYDQSGLPA
jgi:antitoxin VapB